MEEKKKKTSRAIGIDLGTTYSCVANLCNGELTVIPNRDGDRITPSVCAYEGNSRIVGTAAVHKMSVASQNVVYDVKRFIGRSFDDPLLANHLSKYPFKTVRWDNARKQETSTVDQDAKDNIRIMVDREGKPYPYTPVEISGGVLSYLKTCAEEKLGHEIDSVVITVPAHFNDSQKNRTKEAGTVAGFKNIRLLNEPTAAALAYAFEKIKKEASNANAGTEMVLVFDFGGGTLDVTVISFDINNDDGTPFAEVRGIAGDTFLGGVDFDNVLYEYFMNVWKSKNIAGEIKDRQKRRLRIACEKAKRTLSTTDVANIDLECFVGESDFACTITRAKFNELCSKLFEKCINIVRGALLDCAGIDTGKNGSGMINVNDPRISNALKEEKAKIHKVILVGGSSRIPKIRESLSSEFGEKKLCYGIHPDEAIALGAAYQAALLANDADLTDSQSLFLLDVTPLNISIETAGGVATTIIAKNSTYPIKQTQTFTTYSDNQTAVTINIYEGLRQLAKDNHLVGTFTLSGIPPAPRGVPQIEIIMEVDYNGILVVTATDKGTSRCEKLTVTDKNKKYTEEDLAEMVANAQKFKDEDEKMLNLIQARNDCESTIYSSMTTVNQSTLPAEVKDNLLNELKTREQFLTNNPNATIEEYNNVKNEVVELLTKAMGGQGQAGGFDPQQNAGSNNTDNKGPTVEEVD